MKLDIARVRKLLKEFNFATLFREELGWEPQRYDLTVTVEGENYKLETIAHKRGFMALWLKGQMPEYALRRKIEAQVAKSYHEHLVIYSDVGQTTQVWQWVKHEPGKPAASRETTFRVNGNGDGLIQKLEYLAVTLDDEERLTILDVAERVKSGFDVEKVTKKFYERFKDEHDAFLKFVAGIPEEGLQRWYVSVTLNRLMFVYFIQKKGFLDDNADYLRQKLADSQKKGADRFYSEFLCPLFFRGFAAKQHDTETVHLLGNVPYLNGGIFAKHQLEQRYGEKLQIPDAAFERLFDFFEQYQWHLDERPLRKDNEINPDVLGYIFEKYINQKQMGAYYTKEDITEYISKNTVIPFLFDAALTPSPSPKEGGESSIWKLLQANPDRYIYEAVKKGVELPLPTEIAEGESDPARRGGWNKPALAEYALPTEIWRETVARRHKYEETKRQLAGGEVHEINTLITLNLDLRQFAQDVLENAESVDFLRAFWKALNGLSLLDPTVGSGAFLFAALNVLEPLYEACLERMQVFVDELEAAGEPHRPEKLGDFRKVLAEMARHPNQRYFILKSIIVNNLYGVDIMDEAVEICKLRLFLKLVAQVERVEQVEPLPDIDFNIRAGNTLVGFATKEQVFHALEQARNVSQGKMGFADDPKVKVRETASQMSILFPDDLNVLNRIEEKAGDVERLFGLFRQQQTELGGEVNPEDKAELLARLQILEDELNVHLARQYGIQDPRSKEFAAWLKSYQPFHWFAEFYGIMREGGFDVIIGNPPYVEAKELPYKVRENSELGNLHAMVTSRCFVLLQTTGRFSMIVPISLPGTDRLTLVRSTLSDKSLVWVSHFDFRPSKLFEGAEQRLTIFICHRIKTTSKIFSSKYNRWYADERKNLFQIITYSDAGIGLSIRPVWPKTGYGTLLQILKKIHEQRHSLGEYTGRGSHKLFYKNTGILYFTTFTLKAPECFINDIATSSSRETTLAFSELMKCQTSYCLLNSSLFYLMYLVHSNCRDLNPSDINSFRLPETLLSDPELVELSKKLNEIQQNTSRFIVRMQKQTGKVKIQAFYPTNTKPIIDEIDRALARHYGLTAEELDFILNYDVKYRLGASAGGEDGDE